MTPSTIYFCMDHQLHLFRGTCELMQLLVQTKINHSTSAITLLLYTCYFTFRTPCVILSRILHKKGPFRHGIAPNVFPFHACKLYSNVVKNCTRTEGENTFICLHAKHWVNGNKGKTIHYKTTNPTPVPPRHYISQHTHDTH